MSNFGIDARFVKDTDGKDLNSVNAQLAHMATDFKSSKYGAKGDGVTSDSNALIALFNDLNTNGGGYVVIPPGTYLIDTMPSLPSISNVQFVARGQVTFKFTYSGTYASTNKIFTNMYNVSFWGITFSAPNAQLFSVFGDNTNLSGLSFFNCTIEDCTPNFFLGAYKDVIFKDCKWTQSATPPSTQQGSIGGVQTGQFVVRDCDFNFAYNGSSGTLIVVATNATVQAGLHVFISDCDFMTDNLTGYTMDAGIDSEPSGSTPIESLVIKNCNLWNCRAYLTGAKLIEVEGCSFRWTSVGGSSSDACQIDGYNSSATYPDTGTLRIKNVDVVQDQNTSSTYTTTPIKFQRNTNRIIMDDVYVFMNTSGTSGSSYLMEFVGGSVDRLEMNNVEFDATANDGSIGALAFDSSTITHLKLKGVKISKQWQHALIFTGSGTITTFVMEDCDFSNFGSSVGTVPAGWLYKGGGTTFTHQRIKDNVGLNPVGSNVGTPTIPASGTAYTNNTGYPVNVAISGGTVSQIAINGQNTNLTSGSFYLPPDSSVTITYSVAPTWAWLGL